MAAATPPVNRRPRLPDAQHLGPRPGASARKGCAAEVGGAADGPVRNRGPPRAARGPASRRADQCACAAGRGRAAGGAGEAQCACAVGRGGGALSEWTGGLAFWLGSAGLAEPARWGPDPSPEDLRPGGHLPRVGARAAGRERAGGGRLLGGLLDPGPGQRHGMMKTYTARVQLLSF